MTFIQHTNFISLCKNLSQCPTLVLSPTCFQFFSCPPPPPPPTPPCFFLHWPIAGVAASFSVSSSSSSNCRSPRFLAPQTAVESCAACVAPPFSPPGARTVSSPAPTPVDASTCDCCPGFPPPSHGRLRRWNECYRANRPPRICPPLPRPEAW